MLTIVLSLAVALAPHAGAQPSTAQRASASLPARGVLVVGKSLGGVRLGQTQAKVQKLWGRNYINCTTAPCKDPTWLYFYRLGEPLGAAVRFRNKRVVAVFTLGAVPGWKSKEGLAIADPSSKIDELYGNAKYSKCVGFEALSQRRGNVVTSFYLTSGVVYGFALTIPKLTVCQ